MMERKTRKNSREKKLIKSFIIILLLLFVAKILLHVTEYGIVLRSYDELLHFFIITHIISSPGVLFEKTVSQILGLEPYSYPPLFHIISKSIGVTTQFSAIIFSSIIGIVTTVILFLSFKKVFGTRNAIISIIFLSFSPNFLYKTSLFIPENLGLLFFSLFLYFLFSRRYLLSFLSFAPWIITHRSWIVAPLLGIIYLISKLSLRKKYKKVTLILTAVIIGISIPLFLFFDIFERFGATTPSFLGFFKWIGIVQLVAGLIVVPQFLKEKKVEKRFISLWAIVFLLFATVSFRIRDPYLSIPLSILASHFIIKNVKEKRNFKILLAFIAISGFVMCYFSLPYLDKKELDGLMWVKENTPENSTILTWWNVGYKVIGIGERRDILTWEKTVRPFYSTPISLYEARKIYNDMFSMFSSYNEKEIFFLLKNYNVSYIYINRDMRSYGIVKSSLGKLVSFHPAFKPIIINGFSEIYAFNSSALEVKKEKLPELKSTIGKFFSNFWNGYFFVDYGPEMYNGFYRTNAYICKILTLKEEENVSKKICSLIKSSLSTKQLPNGGFADFYPPINSVYATSSVLYFTGDFLTENMKTKARKFIEMRIENLEECEDVNVADLSLSMKYLYLLSMNKEIETAKSYINKCMELKKKNIDKSLEICSGIASYYLLTKDTNIKDELEKCCAFIENIEKYITPRVPEINLKKYKINSACTGKFLKIRENLLFSSPLKGMIEYIDYYSLFLPLNESINYAEVYINKSYNLQ